MRSSARSTEARRGVVLLVVISLLMLFAVAGIAFVIYSKAQATTARVWREGESVRRPDMDPELLFNYFLGQMIYDTDNPLSALRAQSLARNMYGRPGSMTPFAGTGRIHTDPNPAVDDYYQMDYTKYGPVPRDPDAVGSPNVSYTYPDFNNFYLAAVRAGDGAVLTPSFHRQNPAPGQPPITLRPNAGYHPNFPPMADAGGDVRNRPDGPGYLVPGSNPPRYANNDSVWVDAGFPVMKGPDGRKFKPLFAALIEDLDNRVNLNNHGNMIGMWLQWENTKTYTISHQGMCRGEVSFEYILDWPARDKTQKNPEVWNLFKGANGVAGRYDPAQWTGGGYALAPEFDAGSHFFSPTNQDCWPDSPSYENMRLPYNVGAVGTNWGELWRLGWCPKFEHAYSNGWPTNYDKGMNPTQYNFFDPTTNVYYIGGVLRGLQDRRFAHGNMEALLRYNDKGSPALSSELFMLCPNSFGDPATGAKTRRLVTTLSMDLCVPGVTPCIVNPTYRANNSTGFPSTPPIAFPAAPGQGEFGPNWQSTSANFGRINFNRFHATRYPEVNGNIAFNAADAAQCRQAQQERADLAKEIYQRLIFVCGAQDPGAQRALAQLAVNIVDFTNYVPTNKPLVPDDIMTCFEYQPGQWVFGTVLPRLVINEAYVEFGEGANAQRKTDFWIELHNPYKSRSGGGNPITHPSVPFSEDAVARLWNNDQGGYAVYRIQVADAAGAGASIAASPTGDPAGIRKTIDRYTPAPLTNAAQTLVLAGDELNVVRQNDSPDGNYDPSPVHAQAPKEFVFRNCSWGRNRGWYVIGPPAPFPGTDDATQYKKFFATLPHQDLSIQGGQAGDKYTLVLQRLANPYLPPNPSPGPGYNPYVTVDYMDQVEAQDATATRVANRRSVGRNQPFAAHVDSQIKQANPDAVAGQPKHSFFYRNAQKDDDGAPAFAYDYMFWLNRRMLSPMELLHVSGYKPCELTQRYMLGRPDPLTGKPARTGRFGHRAPWQESDKMIYRVLEYFEGFMRNQWTPVGGRDVGRVNINTIWDLETFQGLCDRHGTHYFTDEAVKQIYRQMRYESRTKGESPGPSDRPFMGFAAPYAPVIDQQYPGGNPADRHYHDGAEGAGVNDTLLRAAPPDPAEANLPRGERRRLFEPRYIDPNNPAPAQLRKEACREAGQDPAEPPHPLLRQELLSRIYNNVTTRSSVFAVWLTVGFFEVLDDSDPTVPARLGGELGRSENRNVRHRMFAIVDRTNLTLTRNPQTGGIAHGPRPFFIDSINGAAATGAAEVIRVSVTSGMYEDLSWSIRPGDKLVIGTGSDREIVDVIDVPAANQFRAVFQKAHPAGFAISNAVLGNPGPQPRFEVRNPTYQGVVRYFSIIE